MGRWHAHAARRAGASVVAVVDADPHRASQMIVHLPGARVAARLTDVLDLVDAVHICTPSQTHVSLATEALEAGCHALVEKPLAPTEEATAALLDLAARRNVCVCPVHQFPFQRGVHDAIARLPVIAPLRHVLFRICSAGAVGRDPAQVALDILPHPLSLLTRLSPSIEAVAWSLRQPVVGEIGALGQVGDFTVSVLISTAGRPTTNVMELIGAGGTTYVDLFHGFSVTHLGRVSRWHKATQPFVVATRTMRTAAVNLAGRAWRREPAYPGLRRLLSLFYDAVRGDGPCPITPAEVLAVARAVHHLEQQLR